MSKTIYFYDAWGFIFLYNNANIKTRLSFYLSVGGNRFILKNKLYEEFLSKSSGVDMTLNQQVRKNQNENCS